MATKGGYELLSKEEQGLKVGGESHQCKAKRCIAKTIVLVGLLVGLGAALYFAMPFFQHCVHVVFPPPPPEMDEPVNYLPPQISDPDNSTIQCISDHATQGPCSTTALCCTGCCSRYGWCGTTSDHCGEGCQSTCNPAPPTGEAVSWDTIWCGFSAIGPGESRLREIHPALNNAVAKMGISFGESVSKVEVAAFLGQISHESDYLRAKREYCSLPGANPSCLTNYDHGSWCPEVQPAPGKHYYGRGFIQLTWNCNYDAAGKYLGRNLLADPDVVETSDQVAWETAFYFWVANNIQSLARAGSFGETTRKINSGECNGGNTAAQNSRIKRYQDIRKCLGLSPESDNNKLYC